MAGTGPDGLLLRRRLEHAVEKPYPEISNSEQFSAALTPLYRAKSTPAHHGFPKLVIRSA